MNKKIAIFIAIVIAIFLIGISYYTGLNVGSQKITPGTQKWTGANLEKIDSLLASEAVRWNLSVRGMVKEIADRNLTIAGFNEEGQETASLVVPVSQEAKIISDYILPAGAAKEEITGTISTAGGKEYNLGQKEISFEEIKVDDNVFISLNLKLDYTIEGTEVRVSPADLIPAITRVPESKSSCFILDEEFCNQGKMIYDGGQLVGLGFKLPEGSKIYAPFKGLNEGREALVGINNKHYSAVGLMDISKEDWGQYSTGTYFFAIGYHQMAIETGERVEIEKGQLFVLSGSLSVDNSLGDYNLILNFRNVNFETGEWTNNSGLLKKFFNYID